MTSDADFFYPPGEGPPDDERPLALPTREGPAWTSPEDGKDKGWPDDRYAVEFSLEGEPTTVDSRHPTLPEARTRRYLLRQEMARKGWFEAEITVTDSEHPELGDLIEIEEEELARPKRGRGPGSYGPYGPRDAP